MTSNTAPPPIVVGVDGSAAGQWAMNWAATEVERSRVPLLPVHVGDVGYDARAGKPIEPGLIEDSDGYGRQLLADCIADLADSDPRVNVHARLAAGKPNDVLTDLSATARLVVVGRRRGRQIAAILLGSTARHLAQHALCPVVIISQAARSLSLFGRGTNRVWGRSRATI